jgi:ISXO2-like transposase domain
MFATAKDGISALGLQRALEIGSYPTAWAMLHRLRSVLVRPGRDRLSGTVEVDEMFIGGEEAGRHGGRAKGKKSLVGVAVEVRQPRGYGRCWMEILPDASADSLHRFLTRHVEPGATVITDGWMGYHGIAGLGYAHVRRSQRAARARGEDPGKLVSGVHRVTSLAKRWLLGTHQGSVEDKHLQSCRGQAPAELPERVLLPLQPAPVPQPGLGLLPRARTRRRPRSRAVPGPGRRLEAQGKAARGTRRARPPAEHRTPTGSPAVANRLHGIVRSDEYPYQVK